ncbi:MULTISPECIES: hypothetical protein [unclassified Nocardioides]|uniref:hypothetical protein n=1 Tax=unclassified Nocardioides TaxID=2615069 RepID=UPI0006F48E02|nr:MULTISPECIES: hypothetical protein [unclassified Nocardioides]KRA38758.1 hypothetical protein ASD81_09185 [Nocardioides sp. Root614]KRA92718.1 hypothetical protein ASD84_09450 [Nocardioides sp. Root682]
MRFTSAVLLVLVATVVAPFVIATAWLNAKVEDQQEYVATVAPLANDPDVRRVMADAAAAGAVAALQKHVPVGLPDAVTQWARTASTEVVESPDFPEFWRKANDDLHRDVMTLLEDPDASPDGNLTVDAAPLMAQVLLMLEDRGIPVAALPVIPLEVAVAPRSRVVEAGPAYRSADRVAGWLPFVWAGLVGLAILVAAGWRGRVRIAGLALLGVAAAAALVRLATDPIGEFIADRTDSGQQEMARIMVDTMTGSLSPYAKGFLLGLPLGLVLIGLSLLPRRRHDSPSWDPQEVDPV